jgi:hypothetical protein
MLALVRLPFVIVIVCWHGVELLGALLLHLVTRDV